jgi:hypothetical protein
MATTTTRLGLTKPDFVDVVDISELNSNADDIDAAVGAAVVTSSTRPAVPWSGQIIFETDTNNTLVWDGTAWEAVSGIIPAGSISATELASDAVTTAKILDANVTRAKLATNLAAFTAREVITASNASWPVPSLGNNTIVRVTVIGAGGGGGNGINNTATVSNSGGTTTFNAGGAGTVTATGGAGGRGGYGFNGIGANGAAGWTTDNGGYGGGYTGGADSGYNGEMGRGGVVTVAYLNLTGISTVNVTIGAGGTGTGNAAHVGGTGGRGEVIVEYVAA